MPLYLVAKNVRRPKNGESAAEQTVVAAAI